MPLSSLDLQALSRLRVREAEVLLAAGLCGGSYYLSGYALELALKACIARLFKSDEIPDWALVGELKTHKATDLVRIAGLLPALRTA